ncbi:DUF4349 domain-containing protein [Chryseobacterium sp.]|uniref:DUF4349 domain-containing protein n=1 Tax=Chryseobacterium sp. TaxID=1871047 RepID=UPI0011C8F4B9|nr:DUF4349 domain-containing protein [Chryseobacterium sp.]TXF76175.1 DUF4349 domain-containing protein [Chryseobacterium sp.]
MKNLNSKAVLGFLILTTVFSCKKGEYAGTASENFLAADSAVSVSDSISSVATMQVKDKQFIKTADVSMEVKDVYDATVAIEKSLQELGGFVTSSRLNSQIMSEETFSTSDENAVLVRKFQTENSMQVRVPTEKLGALLQFINDRKIFLNSRVILAEDVTSNIKLAELESQRTAKTQENISKIKTNAQKVELSDQNMSEGNYQKVAGLEMTDQLKYSTVDIHLKEPALRTAEIAVTNTVNMDNKYKFNFLYDLKNATVEGFNLIQKIIIGLASIWPLLLIAGFLFYFLRKRKQAVKFHEISKQK